MEISSLWTEAKRQHRLTKMEKKQETKGCSRNQYKGVYWSISNFLNVKTPVNSEKSVQVLQTSWLSVILIFKTL